MSNFIYEQSQTEWSQSLINVLKPFLREGIEAIFEESNTLCVRTGEHNRYIINFQASLSQIPYWTEAIIHTETERIKLQSGKKYLNDMLTCAILNKIKIMSSIQTGSKQKNIKAKPTNFNKFIHDAYINIARSVYKSCFIFQKGVSSVKKQQNNLLLDKIIEKEIAATIQQSIPEEELLRSYLDENVEYEEEIIIENIDPPVSTKTETQPEPEHITEQPIKKQKIETILIPDYEPVPKIESAPAPEQEPEQLPQLEIEETLPLIPEMPETLETPETSDTQTKNQEDELDAILSAEPDLDDMFE